MKEQEVINNSWRTVALSLLGFFLVTLSGCGSHVALTKETSSSVQLVEVSKEVKSPDDMLVNKGGYYYFGLGGFLVSLLDRPDKEKAKEMDTMLREELPKMFRRQFIATIKQSNLFQNVKGDSDEDMNADALFILSIESYGFGMDNKPSVCATGRLILHSSGKNLSLPADTENSIPAWQKKHACEFGQFIKLPNNSMKFYVNNPEKTREIFSLSVQSVVDQLINDMKENYE